MEDNNSIKKDEKQENTNSSKNKKILRIVIILIAILVYTIIVVNITIKCYENKSSEKSNINNSSDDISIDSAKETQDDSGISITQQEKEEGTAAKIKLNDKITKESKYEMTVVDYEFAKKILPPNTSSYYTYYEAKEDGHQYLDIKLNYKNLDYTDITADEVGSIKIKFANKYEYTSFSIIEDSDGDFTYSNITSIAPLTTGKLHYLFDIPDEVANSSEPIVAYITIGKDMYELAIR